jgi:pSer/pThr/pTyr-binding forkhead associated (FHA) protein
MVSYCLVSPLFTPPVRILRRGRVYNLGRDPGSDFSLPSEAVSRRHAAIEWDPKGGFIVRDLGSKNGTLVNGDRVDRQSLKDGDKIWVGPFSLQFREYQGDISDLLNEATPESDATVAISRDSLVAPPAAGFAGKFAGQELLEICHLMALNEKDGTLHVHGDKRSGKLLFRKGQIVQARMPEIADDGIAALELLSTPQGRFEFVGTRLGDPPPTGSATINTASVIMEAARRRDEASGETARFEPPAK